MPQIPWPSFTLVLTAERPQDIYRRPSVIQLVPALMEPTAPAYLMVHYHFSLSDFLMYQPLILLENH